MKRATKEALWVFIPIICASLLNILASSMNMSDYLQGMLQGMAIVLLLCSVVIIGSVLNCRRRTSHSYGND